MTKSDYAYLAYALFGLIVYLTIESGRTDLIQLNRTEVVLIALVVLTVLTLIVYGLLKVWERRL